MKLRITVLAASLLFGTAALAQTPAVTPNGAVTATGSTAQTKANQRVEAHIKELHAQLKITPAEEQQWTIVAQTMRDNAAQIDQLIVKREQNTSMTALDDLDSYAQITQANSDGVKKLAAVFAPLYNSMPDDQKRNADKVFSETHQRHTMHKRKAAPSQG
jgi:TolA-binding protein